MWLSGLILLLTQRKSPPKERTLMLCDEVGNLGRIEALLTAATLLRSSGLTLWSFWQNAAQLKIYGEQANTLTDNAGVIQIFGVRLPDGTGSRECHRRDFSGRAAAHAGE